MASNAIFSFLEPDPGLVGKHLIQLSTGTPKDARVGADWALQIGFKYLDGAILVTPSQMGTEEAFILVSGENAALICEAEGFNIDYFSKLIQDWAPAVGSILKQCGDMIKTNNFSNSESSLQTCALSTALILKQAKESRLNSLFPAFVSFLFKMGLDEGLADEDGIAIVKVMRERSSG
ncbi:MAG: hypothetical protein HC880_05485 [Bacteroidia bacterium]|nr:hypothetical protein [Bacteroidia bacterium]